MYFRDRMLNPPRTTYVMCMVPDGRYLMTRTGHWAHSPHNNIGWAVTLNKTTNIYPEFAYNGTTDHAHISAEDLLFTAFEFEIQKSCEFLKYVYTAKVGSTNVYGLTDVFLMKFTKMVTLILGSKREMKAVREGELRYILDKETASLTTATQDIIRYFLEEKDK